MLIACWYQWEEGVPEEQIRSGLRDTRKRVTVDILLPGPTNLDQITASIQSHRKVQVKYCPPQAYLTSRRAAVKTVTASVDLDSLNEQQQSDVIGMMHATSRTQGFERALRETIRNQQKEITFDIDFPFDIDLFFCNRDDWGNAPHPRAPDAGGAPISIGMYRCTDPVMIRNNQHVWILHLELTETWRPEYWADAASPRSYHNYSAYA